MFVCGNDAGAKSQVSEAIRQLGWEPFASGSIRAARALEPLYAGVYSGLPEQPVDPRIQARDAVEIAAWTASSNDGCIAGLRILRSRH